MMTEHHALPEESRQVIAANVRAYRARRNLNQDDVVAGMRELGFTVWRRQTIGQIETGRRRVLAEEIIGLAKVFGTVPDRLLSDF